MKSNHVLHVHDGDALNTLRNFLSDWWLKVGLDAMLAPLDLPDHGGVAPGVIEHPGDVDQVNPFLPMMPTNSAPMVDGLIREHPSGRLAVILRPCELRSLVELGKRNRVHYLAGIEGGNQKNLVVIGVDCMGTYSSAEFARLVDPFHDVPEMIRPALSYGNRKNTPACKLRSACRMCNSTISLGADMIIGSIGSSSEGYLLVMTPDEAKDTNLNLDEITDGRAKEAQVAHRDSILTKLADERSKFRSDLISRQTWQPDDLNSLMGAFARCTLCADCLDACPLYDGELSGMLGVKESHQRTHPLLTELVSVSRWLASCSGCGMCQEACEHGVSLMPIVITLSHRIQHELGYMPGDPNQRLPWTG